MGHTYLNKLIGTYPYKNDNIPVYKFGYSKLFNSCKESADKFVEKGWDEEKQMYYYLVYFNKEQKS